MSDFAQLPADFGMRIKAARGYMGDLSQKALGDKLGYGVTYVKQLESGPKQLKQVQARGLVDQLAEISGLPIEFFLGLDRPTPVEERLTAIEEQLREAAFAANNREMAIEKQLREVAQAIDRLRPPQQL